MAEGTGLDTRHPQWQKSIYTWTLIRDSLKGEDAMKMKNEQYLPMPAGMLDLPPAASYQYIRGSQTDSSTLDPYLSNSITSALNPNYHQNPAYAAYKSRAQFPDITAYILRGLLGMAGSEKPTIKLPSGMQYLLSNATHDGIGLHELYIRTLIEVLTVGRHGILIDVDETNGRPVYVPYIAESITNWKTGSLANGGHGITLLSLIEEPDDQYNDISELTLSDGIPTKMFEQPDNYRFRILGLFDGVYTSLTASPDDKVLNADTALQPTVRGRKLKKIPFFMIGSIMNSVGVDPAPMAGVANTALQIYMKNADLSNAEYMSCNPTLIITGADKKEAPKAMGSTVSLMFENPDARADYTKTDTSALDHVLKHIDDLYEQAVQYGAQLLDSSKKAAESAETLRLKQTSSGATLLSTVNSVTMAFQQILDTTADWMGFNKKEIEFTPITEFSGELTAKEKEVLLESWIKGAITKRTLLDNYRRAGVLGEGRTVDQELIDLINERLDHKAFSVENNRPQPSQPQQPVVEDEPPPEE